MKTGLESLDTGAPDITYEGNEGPKSPQQEQQMQMAQLEEEYEKYVFEMEEQGIEPMSMQQFLQQIAAEAQMSSQPQGIESMMQEPRTMAAGGGIMRTGFQGGGASWGPGAGSPGTTKSGGSKSGGGNKSGGGGGGGGGNQNTGNAREDYITNYVSKGKVKGGGEKKKGTVDNNNDGRDDRTGEDIYKDRTVTKEEIDRGQSNYQEQFNDIVTGSKPMGLSQRNQVAYQNRIYNQRRNNIINQLKEAGLLTDEDDKMTIEQLRDRFQNTDDLKGADYGTRTMKSFDEIPSIQDMVDKGYYKKGGVFDKNSPNYDPTRIPTPFKPTGFTWLDILGEKMAGPLTSEYLGKQFDELQGISGLTGDLYKDENSIQRLMEKYEPNRYKLLYPELSGGGGGGGQPTTPDPTVPDPTVPDPTVPDPTTPDPGIPTDPVTGLASTNQYYIPGASNFYSNLPSNQFNQSTNMLTLADGGRIGYAGGGITDLRQGYFLGKLVKSITKPFKKAFKGFKKIAKSPMGKMALLALGGYYMGGGMNLGGARMFPGNTGFSMQNLPGASFFNKAPTNKILTENAIRSPLVESGPSVVKQLAKKTVNPSGNWLTKAMSSAFKPENAFATITGISGLSGLYTNYINNKREDESMADYQRRLEEERGNFAPIPVAPVQFAANGGRIGYAGGKDHRAAALSAIYGEDDDEEFANGGSAGMPPVSIAPEGFNSQSFGDDESTGMAQATPQNPMPMAPQMDPRMMQQMDPRMMAQRGMPRRMAAEGGLMNLGGMEKDYRAEGGFVPLGGEERADDVPARLSKNEFVFTADAVRNAGGGDIDKGAEIMENLMENLEAGGKVSQQSQGLEGAREMFATQQRLGEVL